MAKVHGLFKMTINTKNIHYSLLHKCFIVKDISIFVDARLLQTDANAILNYSHAKVQTSYINLFLFRVDN